MMSDGTRDASKSGKIPRSELEPLLQREQERPKTVPEMPETEDIGSTTGIMPIYREPADDTAERDEDTPAV
jgi:hypothetical protein